LIPSYLKDAHCAFIIYDIGKKSTLNDIDFWVKMFNDNKGGDGFVFVVGNKNDLEYRDVKEE
jgi:GTPase SAR1 family protein